MTLVRSMIVHDPSSSTIDHHPVSVGSNKREFDSYTSLKVCDPRCDVGC